MEHATCAFFISSAWCHLILRYFTDDHVNRQCNSCASGLVENGLQQVPGLKDTTAPFAAYDCKHYGLMVIVQLIQQCNCYDRLRAVSSLGDLIFMQVSSNKTARKFPQTNHTTSNIFDDNDCRPCNLMVTVQLIKRSNYSNLCWTPRTLYSCFDWLAMFHTLSLANHSSHYERGCSKIEYVKTKVM